MAELAVAAGVSRQHISDILHRRRVVGKDLAVRLEKVSLKTLRRRISAMAWLFNDVTDHPAFFTKRSAAKRKRK